MQARLQILLALLLATAAHAQTPKPNEGAQSPSKEGVTTGQPRQPAQPPITSSGFVKTGPIPFEDITQRSGLASFHHQMGTPDKNYILDSVGSGVALLDYDQDGWLDVYLVNGSTYDAQSGKSPSPHAALFHNNHDGTFTDVTAKAGVANDRWGFGAAAADYDNDGYPDLYVTNFGKNRLFHNNHDGTFTDVAEKAGVALGNWSTGATWGDYDGDGRLDLFVPGYVHYDLAHPPSQGTADTTYSFCTFRGVRVMCGPHGLPGEPDHLFRNKGDGTFEDVSLKAGVADKPAYYGLTSLFVDINNDGRPDLLVGNDSTPNYLYLNKGDGTFEDASYASGYALNGGGRETASMGIAAGDLTHTGPARPLQHHLLRRLQAHLPQRRRGQLHRRQLPVQNRRTHHPLPRLGHRLLRLRQRRVARPPLRQRPHLPPGRPRTLGHLLAPAPPPLPLRAGQTRTRPPRRRFRPLQTSPRPRPRHRRPLQLGPPRRRHQQPRRHPQPLPQHRPNQWKQPNHWITLKLIGGPKSPRDAIGATVYLTAAGIRQRADVLSGGSFASTSDPRLHFGLGPATAINKIEIRWPDGLTETIPPPPIDTITNITEGKGISTSK